MMVEHYVASGVASDNVIDILAPKARPGDLPLQIPFVTCQPITQTAA
jgi:hypothetical protein